MDATEYFGGNYLKAADINEPKTLTITKTTEKQIEGVTKLVVHFDETDKTLVLNKINTTRIIEWTGSKMTENWPGKQITLVKSSVEYDGKDVPCIRVKKKENQA